MHAICLNVLCVYFLRPRRCLRAHVISHTAVHIKRRPPEPNSASEQQNNAECAKTPPGSPRGGSKRVLTGPPLGPWPPRPPQTPGPSKPWGRSAWSAPWSWWTRRASMWSATYCRSGRSRRPCTPRAGCLNDFWFAFHTTLRYFAYLKLCFCIVCFLLCGVWRFRFNSTCDCKSPLYLDLIF